MTAVPFVAVALDQVTRSRARADSDRDALLAADQSAANTADHRADDRAFGPAVVDATVASLLSG